MQLKRLSLLLKVTIFIASVIKELIDDNYRFEVNGKVGEYRNIKKCIKIGEIVCVYVPTLSSHHI